MVLSDIEKVLKIHQSALSFLGINFIKEFVSFNIVQKLYRIIIWTFAVSYNATIFKSLMYELHDLSLTDRFLLIVSASSVTEELIRIIVLFLRRKNFLFLYNWMVDRHSPETDQIITKYSTVSFGKLGTYLLRIWR